MIWVGLVVFFWLICLAWYIYAHLKYSGEDVCLLCAEGRFDECSEARRIMGITNE